MSYLYAQSQGGAPPRSPYAQPASIQPQVSYGTPTAQYAPNPQSYAAAKSPYVQPTTIGAGTMLVPTTPAPQLMSPSAPAQYLPTGGQLLVGAAAAQQAQAPAQPFSGNVQAGSVTYTTTTDALGRVTYHHFKAEPALYRSPQGVTYTGIQWVPTETTMTPPVGVAPAGPEIIASFRGQLPGTAGMDPMKQAMSPAAMVSPMSNAYPEESTRDWDREERRRKKEERKREAAYEAERYRERLEEQEIRRRERDVETDRDRRARRSSVGYGLGADLKSGDIRARSRSRVRDPLREREFREREERDLERRMDELSVGARGYDDYDAPPPPSRGTRSRRQSMSAPKYDDYEDDRDYDDYAEAPQARRRSNIYGGGRQSRPSSMYAPKDGYERDRDFDRGGYNSTGRSRPGSMYGGRVSPAPADTYPPGHIMAGQPVSGYGGSAGLVASPRSGMPGLSPRSGGAMLPGPSPRMGGSALLGGGGGFGMPVPNPAPQEMLTRPEAFTREINRAQAFTPFNMIPVTDMEDFLRDVIHPRPAVLGTHDVRPEDWGRLMNDLALAWQGRLPLPSDGPVKRSDLVIDLLDLWNQEFFLPRFVELAFYKGRTPRSGSGVGRPENRLLPEQLSMLSQEGGLGATDSDSDSEDEYAQGFGVRHGRDHNKALRTKKKLEAKVQREMELGKRYSLWLLYVPPTY